MRDLSIAVPLYLVIGSLKFWAAPKLLALEHRGLCMLALFTGIWSAIPCACVSAPFALYGLVVIQNKEVVWAFREVAKGRAASDVLWEWSEK